MTPGRRAQPRADHRHVASVVDDAVLLLERGLVLLIHHDQSQSLDRRKHRRPRPHNNPRVPAPHPPPLARPFRIGQREGFRAVDKATGKVISELQLPSMATGIPMTYMVDGRQYIVVAVGAAGVPAELVALALP